MDQKKKRPVTRLQVESDLLITQAADLLEQLYWKQDLQERMALEEPLAAIQKELAHIKDIVGI